MASGDTLLLFNAFSKTDGTSQIGFKNGHPVLLFDGATNETAEFEAVMPQSYAASGVTAYIHWGSNGTTGDADWDLAWERIGDQQQDIDADSFAAVQSVDNTTVPATSGFVDIVSIAFTNGAQMDSVAVGESFRLQLTRDAVSDSSTDDIFLTHLELRET